MHTNELIYDYTAQRTGAIYRAVDGKLIGSGVFISPQGHMLTCAHLQITDPSQVYVRDADNRRLKVVSVESYQDIDASLLLCEKANYRFSFFTINTKLAQLNRDVLVFGFPDREHFQEGFGRTSTIVSKGSLRVGDSTIQVCGLDGANVSEGMSGGPVVDLRTKELIGIILGYDKSLEKSIYNINRELFALQAQRLDDLFIPVDVIVDRIEKIRVIAMVNKNDEHLKLVNRVVSILDLLGFKSNLVDLENNQRFSIHSHVTVGFVSFEMLVFCFSQGDNTVTPSIIRKLTREASNYADEVGRKIEKVCIVIKNEIDKESLSLAKNSQIEILNADDLFSNLIDFSDYLELAIEQWREDQTNISQKYVDLRAKRLVGPRFMPIDSVEDFIQDWIKNSDKSKLLVLALPLTEP